MNFKEITLEDRDRFLKHYIKHPPKTSFHSFANLFLWRGAEKLEFCEHNGFIIVTGLSVYKGERYIMFPLGSGDCRKLTNSFIDMYGMDFQIFAITEENAKNLDKLCNRAYDITHMRSMDNYIYEVESLITLSGKKLHSKRNHINKFKSLYNYSYERLNEENFDECMEFACRWYQEKEGADSTLLYERQAVKDALTYHKELELKCGMIKVDGKVVAFSVGERLNHDTVLIHIEKADTDYDGAYAIINNEFLKNEWSEFKYVNREEDMGLEGLRKAKLSYRPCEILKIYKATPKRPE